MRDYGDRRFDPGDPRAFRSDAAINLELGRLSRDEQRRYRGMTDREGRDNDNRLAEDTQRRYKRMTDPERQRYIDDLQSERRFLVAAVGRVGSLRVHELDAGQGLGSYALRAVGANGASVTSDDSLAAEWRLRCATFTGRGWTAPRTLETRLAPPSQEILGTPLSPAASLKAAR